MCFTTFNVYEWLISDLGDLKCAFLVTSLSFVYKIMNLESFILKEYFAHISEKSTYQMHFKYWFSVTKILGYNKLSSCSLYNGGRTKWIGNTILSPCLLGNHLVIPDCRSRWVSIPLVGISITQEDSHVIILLALTKHTWS